MAYSGATQLREKEDSLYYLKNSSELLGKREACYKTSYPKVPTTLVEICSFALPNAVRARPKSQTLGEKIMFQQYIAGFETSVYDMRV